MCTVCYAEKKLFDQVCLACFLCVITCCTPCHTHTHIHMQLHTLNSCWTFLKEIRSSSVSWLLSFHLFSRPRRRIEPVSVLGLGSLCSHTDICNIKPIYSRHRERERGIKGKPIGLHMQPERKRGSVQRGEHKRGLWVSKSWPCHLLVHENTARLMKVSEPGAARYTSLILSFISVLSPPHLFSLWNITLKTIQIDVGLCALWRQLGCHEQWIANCRMRRLSSHQCI